MLNPSSMIFPSLLGAGYWYRCQSIGKPSQLLIIGTLNAKHMALTLYIEMKGALPTHQWTVSIFLIYARLNAWKGRSAIKFHI